LRHKSLSLLDFPFPFLYFPLLGIHAVFCPLVSLKSPCYTLHCP